MNIEPLFIITLVGMSMLGYFYGLEAACISGIVGLGLLINKLFTQFKTMRSSLSRWEAVVDKFESALSGPTKGSS